MKFIPNPQMADQLRGDPEFQQMQAKVAREIASSAGRVMASVGAGRVARSIYAENGTVVLPFPAHLVEFGSVNNPAYAPLRRGTIAAGYRFQPSPKQ